MSLYCEQLQRRSSSRRRSRRTAKTSTWERERFRRAHVEGVSASHDSNRQIKKGSRFSQIIIFIPLPFHSCYKLAKFSYVQNSSHRHWFWYGFIFVLMKFSNIPIEFLNIINPINIWSRMSLNHFRSFLIENKNVCNFNVSEITIISLKHASEFQPKFFL